MFFAASALQGFDLMRTGNKLYRGDRENYAEVAERMRSRSLQRSCNDKFLRRRIIFDSQHIRLAADLAVLDVTLPASSRLVYGSRIPFTAPRTLKTRFHESNYLSLTARSKRGGRSEAFANRERRM